MALRLEYREGKSNKFWEIDLQGASFTVRYGRIGTTGQSQSKSFATASQAQTEYNRLVAEKLKKGYQQTSEGSSAARGTLSAEPSGVRKDLHVYNEATGFLITSRRMGGKGLDSATEAWNKAVLRGDLIPISLYQDDPFNIRVVLGEALSAQERDEWVGRLEWHLKIPDGKLALVAGIEYVMEDFDLHAIDDYLLEYLRFVEVPRGTYHATLYTYLNSVNGEPFLARASAHKAEPIAQYFRRTRPGEPFPNWLEHWCVAYPDIDPGHENEWHGKPLPERATDYLDFVLQLEPLEGKSPKRQLEPGGWFEASFEVRVPERCPLGLVVEALEGLPPEPETGTVFPVDVYSVAQHYPLAPIEGGRVAVAIQELDKVFQLAWFCYSWVVPELRISFEQELPWQPAELVEGVLFEHTGRTLKIGFEEIGSLGAQLRRTEQLARNLQTLPEGSTLELLTLGVDFAEKSDAKALGFHRYKGNIVGENWVLEATYPTLQAALLERALALSREVANGKTLQASDETEAQLIFERTLNHIGMFFDENPLEQKGKLLELTKNDAELLKFVAAQAFRLRFADTWPVVELEEDDQDDDILAEPLRLSQVFAGAKGRVYYESVAAAFPPAQAAWVNELEESLEQLGFEFAADLVCNAFPNILIHAFAKPAGDTWAALLIPGLGKGNFELISRFEEGAWLTTTPSAFQQDKPAQKRFFAIHPQASVAELLERHHARKLELAREYGLPRPLEPDAYGLAQDVEASLKVQLGG